MIIQHPKPKRWQCLPTVLAMLTRLTPEQVMEKIGHNGGEITHVGLPEPRKRRGFHIQEIIDVALDLGYAMTEVQCGPTITPYVMGNQAAGSSVRIIKDDDARSRFTYHIESSRGMLATHSKVQGHVFAYENGMVYDPDGNQPPFKFSFEELKKQDKTPAALWRMDRIVT